MNVISLVLFGLADRYWNCLPAALIGYAELYPGFRISLHHSSDAVEHPLFPFLREFAARSGRVQLVELDRQYVGTEPTLWRMLPLWNPGVELWLSRDLDSAPTVAELRAVRAFCSHESSAILGIRSHRLHNGLLLAGLCAFKNPRLDFLRREVGSFEHYWHIYRRLSLGGRWGCDQDMLTVVLRSHAGRILDSRFGPAPVPTLPVLTVPPEVYAGIALDDLNRELVTICDDMSSFAGQPHDDTRPTLSRMLAVEAPAVRLFRQLVRRFPEAERWLLR